MIIFKRIFFIYYAYILIFILRILFQIELIVIKTLIRLNKNLVNNRSKIEYFQDFIFFKNNNIAYFFITIVIKSLFNN